MAIRMRASICDLHNGPTDDEKTRRIRGGILIRRLGRVPANACDRFRRNAAVVEHQESVSPTEEGERRASLVPDAVCPAERRVGRQEALLEDAKTGAAGWKARVGVAPEARKRRTPDAPGIRR